MPPEPTATEDARVWIGRLEPGHDAEHAQFLQWLNGPEAHELFRRRRLSEYTLAEHEGQLKIIFKAPHTGDPRIMIDFLRYPGLWPSYWQFERGGGLDDASASPTDIKVHWRSGRGTE